MKIRGIDKSHGIRSWRITISSAWTSYQNLFAPNLQPNYVYYQNLHKWNKNQNSFSKLHFFLPFFSQQWSVRTWPVVLIFECSSNMCKVEWSIEGSTHECWGTFNMLTFTCTCWIPVCPQPERQPPIPTPNPCCVCVCVCLPISVCVCLCLCVSTCLILRVCLCYFGVGRQNPATLFKFKYRKNLLNGTLTLNLGWLNLWDILFKTNEKNEAENRLTKS